MLSVILVGLPQPGMVSVGCGCRAKARARASYGGIMAVARCSLLIAAASRCVLRLPLLSLPP